MTRTNLVDAYDNRSVVAKLVNMEERISGAEDSIEKTVEDGQTSIDTKVDNGVTKINSLLTGLDDTIAKAEAAAATAETASTKAESAAKSVDEDIVAANNAVIDAQGYAITGKLHDGTVVTSADNIAKSCETYADTASKSATAASTSATAAAASQSVAAQNAGSAEASAREASGYLDTVKASADAAATSETNAAASATKAQEIADSMDTSNMVTLTDTQIISGSKSMTNTGNTIKVASRSTSAAGTDVLNSSDINASNGKYNNLFHRTGSFEVESVSGHKALPRVSILASGTGGGGYTGSSNYSHVASASASIASFLIRRHAFGTSLADRARLLMRIFTPYGDALVSIIFKAVYTGDTTFYYDIASYEVIENHMLGTVDDEISVICKTSSGSSSGTGSGPKIYLTLTFGGATSSSIPYSVELYASTVTPGVTLSGLSDWAIGMTSESLSKIAYSTAITPIIPIKGYTEE